MTNTYRRVPVLLFVSAATLLAQATPSHEWGYTGAEGPAHWADLSPSYGTCGSGTEQSPIDIRAAKPADLPPVQFDYKDTPLKLVNNGHSIQVNYAPGSFITVGGTRFELRQFHFHHPSETQVDGRASEMVIHLVHADPKGNLAVVAVLLRRGAANSTVQKIWAALPGATPSEHEIPGVSVNAKNLLPPNRAYYSYRGSLTTPPCTEGVKWFVLKTPMTVSDAQIAAFAKLFPSNARPIQPLRSRVVEVSR